MQLLDSPFRQNQVRNTSYLLFLDPERMLRSFRLNYGLTSTAEPLGGWEKPDSEIRGHMTGHLLSGLALTYANTNDDAALTRGRYLVSQLAMLQARATTAGFHPGYLSAFPEVYFDWLEQGKPVWSPYYMIHKYLAGMIDQYQLAGDDQALDVAMKLADWVGWRTGTPDVRRDADGPADTNSAGCPKPWPTSTRSPARSGTWPPRSASTTRWCSIRWPTGWTSCPGCRRT